MKPKWAMCIDHHGNDVDHFIDGYFTKQRKCLLIAGAGFDPRATHVTRLLADKLNGRVNGLFIREGRPNPGPELEQRASENMRLMSSFIPNHEVIGIDIFDKDDGASLGGRAIVDELGNRDFTGYTDIIIDMSAMSIGVSFPMVRYVLEHICRTNVVRNLHLMAAANTELDELICSIPGDSVNPIHGFKGGIGVLGGKQSVRLWLPQLALKRKEELRRIYEALHPDDTCPILPFPSSDPKASDRLFEYFIKELESAWEVDTRNILYADERRPLDVYRTILRIDDLRKPVFEDYGGSKIILAPLGSRMLSIGALMAALDRDLAVYYVESIGYDIDWKLVDAMSTNEPDWAHVWLHGEAYPVVSV